LWGLYGADWQAKSGFQGDPTTLKPGDVVGDFNSRRLSPSEATISIPVKGTQDWVLKLTIEGSASTGAGGSVEAGPFLSVQQDGIYLGILGEATWGGGAEAGLSANLKFGLEHTKLPDIGTYSGNGAISATGHIPLGFIPTPAGPIPIQGLVGAKFSPTDGLYGGNIGLGVGVEPGFSANVEWVGASAKVRIWKW